MGKQKDKVLRAILILSKVDYSSRDIADLRLPKNRATVMKYLREAEAKHASGELDIFLPSSSKPKPLYVGDTSDLETVDAIHNQRQTGGGQRINPIRDPMQKLSEWGED